MTATTISVTRSRSGPVLDRLADVSLFAFVAALQLSIALASILLTVMLLCWAALLLKDQSRPSADEDERSRGKRVGHRDHCPCRAGSF